LANDPDGWDGQHVLLFGEVDRQTADGFIMTVEDDSGTVIRRVHVNGVDADVASGSVVQVYGQLSDGGTVQTADSVVVVTAGSGDHRYKLLTSLLGGLLAAGWFLRQWRIDLRALRFVSREQSGESDG
jgi:threonine synthase